MSNEELRDILQKHIKWLNGERDGEKANLSGADLYGADLFEANLSGADLSGANLSEADLSGANLSGADLYGADLFEANLYGADLSGANLYGADLSGADLFEADLSEANLFGANLSGADLFGANLSGAKLYTWQCPIVCPEEGSFIGFKKANSDGMKVVIKLRITENAKRCSATTRKCRCSEAEVMSIESLDGTKQYQEAVSSYDNSFAYNVGEVVKVENFDENRWEECSAGIHFFITREEAVRY